MPELLHVLTNREHAQKASELACEADAAARLALGNVTPGHRDDLLADAAKLRDAATAHALSSLALSLSGDGSVFAFNGSEVSA